MVMVASTTGNVRFYIYIYIYILIVTAGMVVVAAVRNTDGGRTACSVSSSTKGLCRVCRVLFSDACAQCRTTTLTRSSLTWTKRLAWVISHCSQLAMMLGRSPRVFVRRVVESTCIYNVLTVAVLLCDSDSSELERRDYALPVGV
jgi:hypothetical protein